VHELVTTLFTVTMVRVTARVIPEVMMDFPAAQPGRDVARAATRRHDVSS
jgi:hypothetical protein